jgi:hypothetical protein
METKRVEEFDNGVVSNNSMFGTDYDANTITTMIEGIDGTATGAFGNGMRTLQLLLY